MSNRIRKLLLIIIAFLILGSGIRDLPDQTNPNNQPAWAQAIILIDTDQKKGAISLDEAVRLRLQAIRDPYILPDKYQPPLQPLREMPTAAKCGLPEAAAMSVALFKDYDQWSIESKNYIENELQDDTNAYVSSLQRNESHETSHFNISWDPNTIPDGQEYADVLGPLLEQAWELFDTYHGYKMPDPTEYYYWSYCIATSMQPDPDCT